LNPEVTRPRLVAASIYIPGFEVLKDAVVGRIRTFFWTGFDGADDKIDPKYQSDVLARNASPVYASLAWLKEMQAIDDRDVAAFDRVKACHNALAYKLFSTLGPEGLPADFERRSNDSRWGCSSVERRVSIRRPRVNAWALERCDRGSVD